MLRVPKAWALDVADLDAAEALDVKMVHIHDLESRRHYWAATETIRARGFRLDRGAGGQLAVALEWWRPTRREADRIAAARRETEREPQARQLELFGVR
jgi:hypothetical protein